MNAVAGDGLRFMALMIVEKRNAGWQWASVSLQGCIRSEGWKEIEAGRWGPHGSTYVTAAPSWTIQRAG